MHLFHDRDGNFKVSLIGLKLKLFCIVFIYFFFPLLDYSFKPTRPNGGMCIYWNLHISVEEIYKFVFLRMKYSVFSPGDLS